MVSPGETLARGHQETHKKGQSSTAHNTETLRTAHSRMGKLWSVHTMDYYTAMKMNELQLLTWL